jgi:hypothetical protein
LNRRAHAGALALALLGAASTFASVPLAPVPMLPDSGIAISVSGYFQESPIAGYLPLQVKIANDSARAGAWELRFSSTMYASEYESAQRLSVEPGAVRMFELLVPLAVGLHPRGHLGNTVTLQVRGPGVEGRPVTLFTRSFSSTGSGSGAVTAAPLAAFSESLAGTSWTAAADLLKQRNLALLASRFEPAFLPTDWRAYAGFASVFVSDADWRATLVPGARDALLSWVARGGELFVVGPDVRALTLDEGPHGFGSVRLLVDADPAALADAIAAADRSLYSHLDYEHAPLREQTAEVPLPAGTLALAVLAFGLLVGPVNLFWLCRGRRRVRVFLTTPALSLGVALLLSLYVVLQDGLGGEGRRVIAIALLSDAHQAAVVQEQTARCGALWHSGFQAGEPLLAEPAWQDDGYRTSQRALFGTRYEGDWFGSRSIASQVLETVRTSRASVVMQPGDDGAPAVLSTIPVTLATLHLRDAAGGYWRAQQVQTGRRRALSASNQAEYEAWEAVLVATAGPHVRALLTPLRGRPGSFHASADSDQEAIASSPAIRWQAAAVIYTGALAR